MPTRTGWPSNVPRTPVWSRSRLGTVWPSRTGTMSRPLDSCTMESPASGAPLGPILMRLDQVLPLSALFQKYMGEPQLSVYTPIVPSFIRIAPLRRLVSPSRSSLPRFLHVLPPSVDSCMVKPVLNPRSRPSSITTMPPYVPIGLGYFVGWALSAASNFFILTISSAVGSQNASEASSMYRGPLLYNWTIARMSTLASLPLASLVGKRSMTTRYSCQAVPTLTRSRSGRNRWVTPRGMSVRSTRFLISLSALSQTVNSHLAYRSMVNVPTRSMYVHDQPFQPVGRSSLIALSPEWPPETVASGKSLFPRVPSLPSARHAGGFSPIFPCSAPPLVKTLSPAQTSPDSVISVQAKPSVQMNALMHLSPC